MMVALKKLIGEQKIDLTIATRAALSQEALLQIIYPESVLIQRF